MGENICGVFVDGGVDRLEMRAEQKRIAVLRLR